jgi:lipoate-protein ligase A
VSLGRFQDVEKATNVEFCRANGIRVVRRVSGGSAIYTDRGHLIYGLAVGEGVLPSDRVQAFGKTCSAIVRAMESMGILAEYKPVNDVLVGGRKVSGSARTRVGRAILQHGTLILWNSPGMMEGALKMDAEKVRERGFEPSTYVTSLAELLGREPDPEQAKAALVKGFENVFGVKAEPSELTRYETETIERLVREKYGRDDWNLRR